MKSTLNYIDGIDKKRFIEFLIDKHKLTQGNNEQCVYSILTLENIIDFGIKHKETSKDSLFYFLCDIIPEIEPHEAAAFIDDDLLTENTKGLKSSFWSNKTTYYYFFDCLDGVLSDRYYTAKELTELLKGANAEIITEKEIIKTAQNYEATLYRYEMNEENEPINEVCLYDCFY